MPRHALKITPQAEVLTAAAIVKRVQQLTATKPLRSIARVKNGLGRIDEHEHGDAEEAGWMPPGAEPAGLTCPDCGGSLFDTGRRVPRFRCRVGHAWSVEGLAHQQTVALERALWEAARILEEDIAVQERLAARARAAGDRQIALERIESRRARRQDLLELIWSTIERSRRDAPDTTDATAQGRRIG
jgi:two-component system chemotaxis response regulator CheB